MHMKRSRKTANRWGTIRLVNGYMDRLVNGYMEIEEA